MEYKGELKGFPTEIVEKMLERQVEQGNPRNVGVFERMRSAGIESKGFCWENTIEKWQFWNEVVNYRNFELFFEKYPKTEKELTFPREMLVWDYDENWKEVKLVLGIFPERTSHYKVIGSDNVQMNAEDLPVEFPDPLLKKIEKLETELQTLKDEIKSRTAGQCNP